MDKDLKQNKLIKKLGVIFFILLFSLNAKTQQDSLKISLLTYSPGTEIWGAFGHSAVRVQNYTTESDILYNYGIFDFGDSVAKFVWKFLRGKLKYKLGKESTTRVLRYYANKGNKRIIEQELVLTQEENRKILQFLDHNYLPENRYYFYDFFFDNCATRIRDIMENELGGKFNYKKEVKSELTLRQLLDVHIESRPWTDFGMDLLIGIPSDKKATFQEQMFLPEFLSDNLDKGVYLLNEGEKKPLLGEKKIIVGGEYYMNEPGWFRPFTLFGALCVFMLLLTLFFTHNKALAILDSILFFLLGFIGLFLLFMWFGTDHVSTKWNMNMLWANPMYLIFFLGVGRQKIKSMKWAYILALISGILILLTWGFFPQQFHVGIIPIVLMLLIRSGAGLMDIKRKSAVKL